MRKTDGRKTKKTEEEPKARAFNISITLSEKEGQTRLEKFKLKAKATPTEDVNHLIKDKMEALAGVLQREYDGITSRIEDFGNVMDLGVGQMAKHTASKELTEENLRQEVEKVGIQEWRVAVYAVEVCVSCGGAIEEHHGYCNENGKGIVCEPCMEYDRSEHVTVVKFSRDDDPLEIHTIGMYHNDTEGEFKVVWHSDGGWRGHSNIVPSKKWKQLHSDAGLAMSEDEQNLADFDKALRAQLDKMGIEWARVISPTSNIFCCGYDFYVEAKKFGKAEALVRQLANTWRNPTDFAMTALTGKNPRDAEPRDLMFVAAATQIMSREKPEG